MNAITPARSVPALVDQSTVGLITDAEINQQIATAHRFPRSVKLFREEVLTLATISEATAEECSYALPRDGKLIEGPSARFAEIVANAWGNSRAGARVVHEDSNFVTAQGVFHDLQKNVAISFEVRRRITNKAGKRFSADMIAVTGNAASSIALRNSILKGVPAALWRDLWEEARRVAKGDHKTLANRRADALKAFQGYGVTAEQVFGFLTVRGIEDVTTDHLMTLRGLIVAFKDGDAEPEQIFAVNAPPPQAPPAPPEPPAPPPADEAAAPPSTDAPAIGPAAAPASERAGSAPPEEGAGHQPSLTYPGDDAPIDVLAGWARAHLADATADTLETIWNDNIAPRIDGLFPGDQEELVGIYRARERELAP